MKLLCIDLRLFDGGGNGGAAAGDTGTAASGQQQSGAEAPVYQPKHGKKGDAKIVYGKQPAAEVAPQNDPAAGGDADKGADKPKGVITTSDALEAKKQEFDRLINGDYKDLFDERTQAIINRRFKETKALEERTQAVDPLLSVLAQKYKTDDPKALLQAIEADGSYWEQAAEESGMTVEQYKQYQQMMRENQALRREAQERKADLYAQQRMAQWTQEAEQLRGVYPDFDFGAELGNPSFLRMVKAGAPLRHAYEVLHLDDIKTQAQTQAARATEKQVVENIRAKGTRPLENGTSGQTGVIIKNDVSKLSRADRAAIAERARRGEKISF